ncbi:MAG: competence/damage-inducible protein A [Planctomycetes bacterium]|nr:competence/damage-inducible protein A [Planctomycetota bacterium]
MFDKSAILLVVSREILEGAVVDRNAAFIASRIDDIGYRLRSIQVIDRVESEMVSALKWAIDQKPTFVITTGGMGPNWDDSSRNCLSLATGQPLEENAAAVEFVQNSYRRLHAKGIVGSPDLNESRRGMASVPRGAICYENTVGTAPAVQLRVHNTTVFLLPGVPAEMQQFFATNVLPVMNAEGPDTVRGERVIDYHGYDLSQISRALADIAKKHPNVQVRTRTQGFDRTRVIRILLVSEHEDQAQLDKVLYHAEKDMRERLGLEIEPRPTDAGTIGD